MDIFDSIFPCFLLSISALFCCVFFLQRLRWKLKGRTGFYPSSAMLGNALHNLQALAQPQVKHVVEEKQDEHEEDDGDAGPEGPKAHLKRQLRKIREGKELDRLTVFSRY